MKKGGSSQRIDAFHSSVEFKPFRDPLGGGPNGKGCRFANAFHSPGKKGDLSGRVLVIVFMVGMILTSIPVAFAMIVTSILAYRFVCPYSPRGSSPKPIFQRAILLLFAVPYFILAGNIMARDN